MQSAADPYMTGFADGRRSMARSVALKLHGTMPDGDLASLLGLSAAEIPALLLPPEPHPEEGASERHGETKAPIRGLALVEPNFVRLVRLARGLTQPQLAGMLGVNARTVCEWETAPGPVRVKDKSYRRLSKLAEASDKTRTARR